LTATHFSGRKLSATFVAKVAEVDDAKPRLVLIEMPTGASRRSPYDLLYIDRSKYENVVPCWDGKWWSDADAACFLAPTTGSPLRLIINNDVAIVAEYRNALRRKRLGEAMIKRGSPSTHRTSPITCTRCIRRARVAPRKPISATPKSGGAKRLAA
jgi:hypothetical protein